MNCPNCGEEAQVMGWDMQSFGIEASKTFFLCENPDCDQEIFEREGDYTSQGNLFEDIE